MELNKSIAIINECDMNFQTYCVLGVPRSGTSMIAGMLRILGVDMGENIDPDNNEDGKFLIHGGIRELFRKPLDKSILISKYKDLILDNNKKAVWGWKDPLTSYYIDDVHEFLRQPLYIVVTRDPMATTQGELRFRKRLGLDVNPDFFLAGIKDITSEYEQIISFIQKKQPSVIFVSYEKVFRDKLGFVETFCQACNFKVDSEKVSSLVEYIEPSRNTGSIS